MTKATSKTMVPTKKQLWISIFALVLIVIIVISHFWSGYVEFRNSQLLQERFSRYNDSMLLFCYDHDIKPCDNQGIWTWNADHPTNKFDYESAQQQANDVPLSNF